LQVEGAQALALAANSPTSHSATGLPTGLTLSSTTGTISGTPTVAGTFTTTISATNSYGASSETVTFQIVPTGSSPPVLVPVIYGLSLAESGNVNAPFSYQIPTGNNPTSVSVTGPASLSSLGLSVASDGTITGTPTTVGIYSFTVTATNAAGTSTPATLILTIAVRPTLSVTYSIQIGATSTPLSYYDPTVSYNPPLGTATLAPSTSFSVVSGSLPAGVTLLNGQIGGTPTVGTPTGQASSVVLQVSDSSGNSCTTTVPFLIYSGPGLVNGSNGQAIGPQNIAYGAGFGYSVQTITSSATSLTASALPPGWTFTTNGALSGYLSGTATQLGAQSVTFTATDAMGHSSQATLVLTAGPINSSPSANAQVGVPFNFTVTEDNGPTNFQATNLPAGLTINSATGVISGTPVAVDVVPVQLTITDAGGTQSAILTLTIGPGPSDTAVDFQPGVSPTAAYTAPSNTIADDVLEDAQPGNPSSNQRNQTFNSGTTLPVGQLTATKIDRGLLSFDLSALPPGVTITGAALILNASSTNSSGLPLSVEVHQASTSFNPATATWGSNSSYQSAVLASATLNPATVSGATTFSGTAAFVQGVQQAYNQQTPISLVLLAPSAETLAFPTPDYIGFATRATAPTQNPELIVTYNYPASTVPVITSAATAPGTVNLPFSYTVTATAKPTSYSTSTRPSWLSWNAATGVLSGTPPQVGSTSLTVNATNANGTGSQNVAINIDSATPAKMLGLVSGNNQVGAPGALLATPLVVQASSQKQMVYDARGNKTKDYDENGFATLYQYDAFNRLVAQARDMNGNGSIDVGTDLITSFAYDQLNDKIQIQGAAPCVTNS
jgi:YD repeat-containing protein